MALLRDRLTVSERVYHRPIGEEASEFVSAYSHELETQEQPYERNCTATEEWQEVDLGWLKDGVSMLVIRNNEGRRLQRNPTDDVKADIAKRVLLVSPDRSLPWLVRPKESLRGCPSTRLFIRSQHGPIKYTVFAVPR